MVSFSPVKVETETFGVVQQKAVAESLLQLALPPPPPARLPSLAPFLSSLPAHARVNNFLCRRGEIDISARSPRFFSLALFSFYARGGGGNPESW